MKTIEAKIYPSKNQEKTLFSFLEECRLMYNKALETKIKAYKDEGKTISRWDLDKQFKKRYNIPSSVAQEVVKRLSRAYETFFDKRGSFPRFRAKNRWRTIDLRQYGIDFRIEDGYLVCWKKYGLRGIKCRGLQEFQKATNGRIVKRATGWYLQISVETEIEKREKTNKETGIDMGLKYFVADSNGETTKSPQYFRRMQAKLRVQQRKLKNKTKFSMKWKKQAKQIVKTHEHISNQRKDFLHKTSRKYADSNDVVYAEKLNIKGMVQNHHLSKSISDAGWNTFLNYLGYKLEMLNRRLVLVPAHYTSQKCSACGNIVPKSLSVRTHVCPECGFIADRDYNASLNILLLGQGSQTSTYGNSQSVV